MEAQERVGLIARELGRLQAQRKQFKWIAIAVALSSLFLAFLERWYVVFGWIFAICFYVVGSYIGKLNVIETEERLEKAREALSRAPSPDDH